MTFSELHYLIGDNILIILGIDTSGKIASAALCDEEKIIAQTTVITERTQSQMILPICRDILEKSSLTLKDIDGFAVCDGPGSYTGLRIGISAVKAMAFALNKGCIGISTLESLAYNMQGFKGYICSVMTARQNLVYTATFFSDGNKITRFTPDRIISTEALFTDLTVLDSETVLVGDSSKSCCYDYNSEKIKLAPPASRLQQASSLCFAAMNNDFSEPSNINARYLQPTKAEKDRKNS